MGEAVTASAKVFDDRLSCCASQFPTKIRDMRFDDVGVVFPRSGRLRGLAHQEGFFAVVANVNREPRTLTKSRGDVTGQSDFIFHYKDAH
jgi:hypothetical protein